MTDHQLIERIAEEIMGWKIRRIKDRVLADEYEDGIGCVATWRLSDCGVVRRWDPLECDEHAMMLLKSLAKQFRCVEIHITEGGFVVMITAGTSDMDENYPYITDARPTLGDAAVLAARAVLEDR